MCIRDRSSSSPILPAMLRGGSMNSSDLFAIAKNLMPGGVSSPVRAIKPYPFYTAHASGSHLTTVDGGSLIDCCMAYGPLILGHAHPQIRKSIETQLKNGWLFGTPSPLEPAFAKIITGDHKGMDLSLIHISEPTRRTPISYAVFC